MASERCTISFDKTVGDGYIDSDNYLEARENNFSGRINGLLEIEGFAFSG